MMMILPIMMMRTGVGGGRTGLFLVFNDVTGFYGHGITHSGPSLGLISWITIFVLSISKL